MSIAVAAPRPIRVLHLRDSPWIDGPGRTILETATRIDRSRIDYYVGAFVSDSTEAHPLVDALLERGLPVHAIPDRGGVGAEIIEHLVGQVDQLKIDILHTSEFRSNVLALLVRRRRQVKLVSTAHGWIANDLRGNAFSLADRLLLRHFDRVILVSHAMRRRLPKWWVPDRRVRVLHNALMTDTYGQNVIDAGRRVVSPSGEIRILNVGRLSKEKGQELLLQAFAALAHEHPSMRLWFAGVGPLEKQLRDAATALGIEERVTFLGYVSDMPALYRDIDLVVQSSLTEGLPNVMLEVAYLGVPVVATNVGGTAEVIEHGRTGWLVAPGSAQSLVRGILEFAARPVEFVEMARSGRARIVTEFSFAARTQRQLEIYRELIT